MTIKRYNGSSWTEYAPSTVIAQVSGLQTALDAKEVLSNKVTSISGSSTDTQYPSAKCVYDNLLGIREVASGLTASYVTTLVYDSGSKYILYGTSERTLNSTITASTSGVSKKAVASNASYVNFDFTDGGYIYLLTVGKRKTSTIPTGRLRRLPGVARERISAVAGDRQVAISISVVRWSLPLSSCRKICT